MLRNIKNKLNLFFEALLLSKEEKKIISENILLKFDHNKKNLIFEIVPDYYYLIYYKKLFSQDPYKNYNKIGIWTLFLPTQKNANVPHYIIRRVYQKVYYFFLKIKWIKLFKTVGAVKFIDLTNSEFNFFKYKKFNSNKNLNRKKILKYSLGGIEVGDLVYDTYLRYRALPTLFVGDVFKNYLFFKAEKVLKNLEKINKKYCPVVYFTGYSSYLHHGLPVRYFLKKGVKVFSGKNNSQINKQLTKKDPRHVENYEDFVKHFAKIKNKNEILEFSKKKLNERFSGDDRKRLFYMKFNPYNKNYKIGKKLYYDLAKTKGVVFLQDFYDSPHDWGSMIFPDFYIWCIYTLNIIKKYKLPIAVKPHPNMFTFSKETPSLIERLKKRYDKIVWLDHTLSNKYLFKKIDFGISASGSILLELAYHNIVPISCGDHPGKYFDFTLAAKSIMQYKNLLINYRSIKKSINIKNLCAFNYMYYFHENTSINLNDDILIKKLRNKSLFNKKDLALTYD